MRIVLLQAAAGHSIPQLRLVEPRHRAYCEARGIDYEPLYVSDALAENLRNCGRHIYWMKVWLALRALTDIDADAVHRYEHVIWLDADCLIDTDRDIREACPVDGIGVVRHVMPGGWRDYGAEYYDHWNTGAFYATNTPTTRNFVHQWWNEPDEGHPWFDQHAANQVANRVPGVFKEIGREWNSNPPHFLCEGKPCVRAWHGCGTPDFRFSVMQRYVEHGIEDVLLPLSAKPAELIGA